MQENHFKDGEPARSNWMAKYMIEHDQEESVGPLAIWHRYTAPPPVPYNASLAERELVRRGRLASNILLGMLLFLLFSLPLGIIGGERNLLQVFIPSLIMSCIVLVLTRMGRLKLAGILLVVGFEMGYIISFLTTPGGLDVKDIPRFALFVEPVLLAVSFLPARSVFLVAIFNSAFIWCAAAYLPRTAQLETLIASNSLYSLVETPIGLQIIVAFVTYLWVVSSNRAIERADRAELIASLEHDIAEQAAIIMQQKQQLELSIEQIVEAHTRVANGDLDARVPLTQENVLWQVAGALNNLLSRFQKLRHNELELMRARSAVLNQIENIRVAKYNRTRFYPQRSSTIIDPMLVELEGNYILRSLSEGGERAH